MNVRKSTYKDLPRLMEIYAEARQIQIDTGNLHQWKDGYPCEDLIRNDIAKGLSYAVEDGGVIVGAFTFVYGADPTYASIEAGAWLDDTRPYATVHRLASLKDAHGVAAACFEWCDGQSGNIRVDTHEDNFIMRHCILKAGFTYCGIIHLLNGDPRLAFQKISR